MEPQKCLILSQQMVKSILIGVTKLGQRVGFM